MRDYIQELLEKIDINFIYDYIDNYQCVGIFSERMSGKTIISEYFLLSYLIKNGDKTAFFTSKHQLHRDRADALLHKISEIEDNNINYNIREFKNQTDSRVWYGHMNNLVHNLTELNLDLIVIDEINEYNKIREKHIDILRKAVNNGSKFLINGAFNDSLKETLDKLGILNKIKIIDDDFYKNITHHSRSLKINRIISNEKRDSVYI